MKVQYITSSKAIGDKFIHYIIIPKTVLDWAEADCFCPSALCSNVCLFLSKYMTLYTTKSTWLQPVLLSFHDHFRISVFWFQWRISISGQELPSVALHSADIDQVLSLWQEQFSHKRKVWHSSASSCQPGNCFSPRMFFWVVTLYHTISSLLLATLYHIICTYWGENQVHFIYTSNYTSRTLFSHLVRCTQQIYVKKYVCLVWIFFFFRWPTPLVVQIVIKRELSLS